MSPTTVHFNGSVNLADGETVMREITSRIPSGVRRIPDGETGDRQNWIFFQLAKFWATPGLEKAVAEDTPDGDYQQLPKVRLATGAEPDDVTWPDLGYAAAQGESYEVFARLRDEGVIPAGVRMQVQYPTPLASINAWLVPDDQRRMEPSYERALFADLARFLASVPHDDIAVQWDVAVEFGILEGASEGAEMYSFDAVVERLARCVDEVPDDVQAGLHLCYGDYGHRHFKEPESLEMQVRVANAVVERVHHPVGFFAFTVPQNRGDAAYFAPLSELAVPAETELYFALVPYHPDTQKPETTAEQVATIDGLLGGREWGICTECGMARAERDDVPRLLDLHREILAAHG